MRLPDLILLTLLAAVGLGGCLTDRAGRAAEGDAAGADTAVDTSSDDTSGPPCAGGCDDGDPCTDDWCDDGGECQHVWFGPPYLPGPACVGDGDCDDGDPCTDDWCEDAGTDACFGPQRYCRSEPAPDCDHACSGKGVTPLAEVFYGRTAPGTVKTAGQLTMAALGRSCDDGPGCGCEGVPALTDGDVEVALSPASPLADDAAWRCTSTGCQDVETRCEPPVWGARYWVWGSPLPAGVPYRGDGGEAGAPRPPYAERLAAEGYCLETSADALPGRYAIRAALLGEEIETTGELQGADAAGALTLTIAATACGICPGGVYPESVASVVPGDGWIDVTLPVPGAGVTQPTVTARLYSDRSVLSGPLVMGGDGSEVGTLRLRRQ